MRSVRLGQRTTHVRETLRNPTFMNPGHFPTGRLPLPFLAGQIPPPDISLQFLAGQTTPDNVPSQSSFVFKYD
jgi:hypothetical protein